MDFLNKQIRDPAFLGGTNLSPPLTPGERDVIERTIKEKYERDGRMFYKHVVCRPPPPTTSEHRSRCEYIVRARRLVAHPNTTELVYLDSDREVANPVYPVWLILSAGNPTNGLVNKLCSRRPQLIDAQHPFYARPFTSVYGSYLLAPHQGSPCL